MVENALYLADVLVQMDGMVMTAKKVCTFQM